LTSLPPLQEQPVWEKLQEAIQTKLQEGEVSKCKLCFSTENCFLVFNVFCSPHMATNMEIFQKKM
jgi:hypothetical protein